MIGRQVWYGYGSGENRVENKGIIRDKNKFTDVVRNENNEVIGVSQHDIYLIEKEDGSVENIHPNNIIKLL